MILILVIAFVIVWHSTLFAQACFFQGKPSASRSAPRPAMFTICTRDFLPSSGLNTSREIPTLSFKTCRERHH